MLILALLFFAGMRFRDPQPAVTPAPADPSGSASHVAVVLLAVATALAISVGPAFAYWRENRTIVANADALTRPLALDGWTQIPTTGNWRPVYNDPDQELITSVKQAATAGAPVDLVVEYYGRMRPRHSLIASTNRVWDVHTWHRVRSGTVSAPFGGHTVHFDETLIGSGIEQRLVWSVFWLDDRFTNSSMTVKLLQLKTALAGGEGAALVAISTPVDGAMSHVRERLRDSLSALHDIPARLREAGLAAAPAH
jgi:EpsI family protein